MSAHTGVGSSQRVRHVKPYFSVKCDYSRGGPFRGECDQFLAAEFWHVNNNGLCASHLVILLSRSTLRHDTLCIWKSKTINILNNNWYDVLFKKTVINFNVMTKLSNIPWKFPHNLTSLLGFMLILEGVFRKLKQCKQTTGPKSVVPGAEMHRAGGKNPSYHVIMSI